MWKINEYSLEGKTWQSPLCLHRSAFPASAPSPAGRISSPYFLSFLPLFLFLSPSISHSLFLSESCRDRSVPIVLRRLTESALKEDSLTSATFQTKSRPITSRRLKIPACINLSVLQRETYKFRSGNKVDVTSEKVFFYRLNSIKLTVKLQQKV